MVEIGEVVEHPQYGRGRIRAVLDGGRRWRVLFDKAPQLPRTVRATDLQSIAQPAVLSPETAEGPAPDLRQALEALRLGVVPTTALDAITVGRSEELAAIKRLVENTRGMLLFSGSYGSGKTHMLEVAESHALDANMLVARVTFDPLETPPSHPLRLYRSLAQDLRYPDGSSQGLRTLLEKLSGSEPHESPTGNRYHRYLSPSLWAMGKADPLLAEDMLAFVQGQLSQASQDLNKALKRQGWSGPGLLALPDYRTFGQIMAHLLGGIAAWSRDAGYRGLLVLADEAEYLDNLPSMGRALATNVLRYLAMACLPARELSFDPSTVYRGGHATHRSIPAVFASDQPLAAACAFTPNPGIRQILQGIANRESVMISLEPIPSWELATLSDYILALYQKAFEDLTPPQEHQRTLRSRLTRAIRNGELETTRQAARMVVEFWDIYLRNPQRALAALAP